ncbi:uncharacterized protein LOC128670911 [Plodia interpunctella]|uniref:uncharacterized protein LOC128670911 n=1 Tax=Plodia interpunctella TaxID=58824 RepID=UPI003101835B
MKSIVFLGLLAVACAAPQAPAEPIPILRQESQVNPDGSYQYSYETGNGINAEEQGSLKNVGAEEPALQVQGQFQYPSEEGGNIQLTYVANENGFQPQGAHLPTPPPIPAAIQRALDYLATAPPQPQVLALCVAATNAAVARPWQQAGQVAQVAAKVAAAPAVAAVTAAKVVASAAGDVGATILKSESDVQPDRFGYTFETDNGISASASGALKTVDNIDTLAFTGSYRYVAPDGTNVQFQYVADENGYQPISDLLPTPPPVPEAIQRALEYIAAHPPPPERS